MKRQLGAWSWLRTIVGGLKNKGKRQRAKRRPLPRPQLETLENRLTPSLAYAAADYDGDARSDLALWTPRQDAGASTFFTRGGDGVTYPAAWGELFDVPITGDYDGDGRADHAV